MRAPRPVSGRTQAHILLSPAWHALPMFKQLQSVSAYSAPIMVFCFLLALLRLASPGYVSGARRKHFGSAGSAHWLHICKSCPPAEPEACVSSGRAYYRPASQEALNTLSPALFAPPPVNGVLPVACCILWVLNTILLRSKLTAKAFLLAPAQPRVVVSLKQKNEKRHGFAMPFFALYHRARRGAEGHFCPQPQREQPASTRQESRPVTVKAVPLISAPSRKARI